MDFPWPAPGLSAVPGSGGSRRNVRKRSTQFSAVDGRSYRAVPPSSVSHPDAVAVVPVGTQNVRIRSSQFSVVDCAVLLCSGTRWTVVGRHSSSAVVLRVVLHVVLHVVL